MFGLHHALSWANPAFFVIYYNTKKHNKLMALIAYVISSDLHYFIA